MAKNLFSFDASRETPEMLAERRARAQALAEQIGGATTIGGGIGDIFRGLGAGLSRYRADSAEREGRASGRTAMDGLLDILSQPPAQPMTSPGNDAVRESLKTGIATGTVPPLATYTPPGPQNAGDPNGRPRPSYAPPEAYDAEPPEEQAVHEDMAPPVAQPANPNAAVMAQMVAILRNPWVTEADKAMVRERYSKLLEKSDPDYIYNQGVQRQKDVLEIGKAKIELHNLENPDRPMVPWTDGNTGDLYAYEPHDPVGTKVLVQKAGPKMGEDDVKIVPKGARVFKGGKFLEEGPDAAPEIDVENAIKIQKNFEGQPSMANIQTIAPTLKSMYRSISDPSAMADLDFVYGLAKILDPTSVVRESEAGLVIDSQGIAPQMLGQLNKMLAGQQVLDVKTRVNLFNVAARRAEELRNASLEDRSFAARQLRSMKIPEDDYLRQVPRIPRFGPEQNMPQPMGAAPRAPKPPVSAAPPPDWDPEDWKYLTPQEQQRALSP